MIRRFLPALAGLALLGAAPPLEHCTPGPWLVFFSRNSAVVSEEGTQVLNHLMENYAGLCGPFRLFVTGHIDGGERNGVDSKRAEAVRKLLKRRGVPAAHIATEAAGTKEPRMIIEPGNVEPQNQRVFIMVGPL